MASGTPVFLSQIEFQEYQDLVTHLNIQDRWYELGGKHMKLKPLDLERMRQKSSGGAGQTPADLLLSTFCQRNGTVLELFKFLFHMEMYQAMEGIKKYVPIKFHKYINCGHVAPLRETQAVPPPKPYDHIGDSTLRVNMDISEISQEKLHAKDLTMSNAVCFGPQETAVKMVDYSNWNIPSNAKARPVTETIVKPTSHIPQSTLKPSNNGPEFNILPSAAGIDTKGMTKSPKTNSVTSMLKQTGPAAIPISDPELMLKLVPFAKLEEACDSWNEHNILGKGGFGEVFKGKLDGQLVAVKRIRKDKRSPLNNPQGGENQDNKEFEKCVDQVITELRALHTYPGENVLRLYAYCFDEAMKTDPCLVYQYMPNGSVSDRLKMRGGTPPLTWEQRSNIAIGVARGLNHVHINKIVHGDIKSANVLLDKHFEPFIGDFGLAQGFNPKTQYSFRVVTSVQGTEPYLPEDFIRNRELCPAVDTFSYGIFLFELVTAKSPSWKDEKSHSRIRDILLHSDDVKPWTDPVLPPSQWSSWLFLIGKDCAKENRRKRPEMGTVLDRLEKLQQYTNSRTSPIALQLGHDGRKQQKILNYYGGPPRIANPAHHLDPNQHAFVYGVSPSQNVLDTSNGAEAQLPHPSPTPAQPHHPSPTLSQPHHPSPTPAQPHHPSPTPAQLPMRKNFVSGQSGQTTVTSDEFTYSKSILDAVADRGKNHMPFNDGLPDLSLLNMPKLTDGIPDISLLRLNPDLSRTDNGIPDLSRTGPDLSRTDRGIPELSRTGPDLSRTDGIPDISLLRLTPEQKSANPAMTALDMVFHMEEDHPGVNIPGHGSNFPVQGPYIPVQGPYNPGQGPYNYNQRQGPNIPVHGPFRPTAPSAIPDLSMIGDSSIPNIPDLSRIADSTSGIPDLSRLMPDNSPDLSRTDNWIPDLSRTDNGIPELPKISHDLDSRLTAIDSSLSSLGDDMLSSILGNKE